MTAFSNILLEVFRDSDVIGRLGGDEFVVLLTNTNSVEMAEVLQRLHALVAKHNTSAMRGYDISYSLGAIEYDAKKHDSVASLMDIADKLMYVNKKKNITK